MPFSRFHQSGKPRNYLITLSFLLLTQIIIIVIVIIIIYLTGFNVDFYQSNISLTHEKKILKERIDELETLNNKLIESVELKNNTFPSETHSQVEPTHVSSMSRRIIIEDETPNENNEFKLKLETVNNNNLALQKKITELETDLNEKKIFLAVKQQKNKIIALKNIIFYQDTTIKGLEEKIEWLMEDNDVIVPNMLKRINIK